MATGSSGPAYTLSMESGNTSVDPDEYWFSLLGDPFMTRFNSTDTVLVTVIMPLILLVGLVTNSTFLFVVYRVTWMRTNVNTYLFHLAIADILFLTIGVGDKLWHYSRTPLAYDLSFRGTAGCVLSDLLKDSAYFAGLFLITLVSVHRFNAVCRPHSGSHQQTRASTMRWIGTAWAAGSLLSGALIPSYCVFRVHHFPTFPDWPEFAGLPELIGQCMAVEEWMSTVANFMQTVPFFLAMSLNTMLYVRIVLSLNQIVSKGGEFGCKDVNERIRNRVTKMLVANGCVFFLCLFPFELTSLLRFSGFYQVGEAWLHAFRILVYLNSVVNPIIYGVTNSKYRKAYGLAFSCLQSRSRDMVRYELSIPLNRMKDRPTTAVTECRARDGGDS